MARTAQASAKTRPLFMFYPLSPSGGTFKRGRILSGQRGQGARGDVLDAPGAGDLAVLRRGRVPGSRPLAVVADQRPGLRPVHLQALPDRLLAVVVALHQRLAGRVIAALAPGRIELDM